MSNTTTVSVNIKGMQIRNEKLAPDRWSPMVPSRLRPLTKVRAPSGQSKRVKKHRWLARHFLLALSTGEARRALARGCVVTLTRVSARRLMDASESLRSAFAAVRDGVADALEIDDRDFEEGGLIQWKYEQDQGEAAVRIELVAMDELPDYEERLARSKHRGVGEIRKGKPVISAELIADVDLGVALP